MSQFSSFSYGYDPIDWGKVIKTIFWILVCIGALVVMFSNIITEDAAVARFAEQAQVKTSDIEVIRMSNNAIIFGDPHDVVFEMEIGGKPVQGRCTSGAFSPMICRLYKGEE